MTVHSIVAAAIAISILSGPAAGAQGKSEQRGKGKPPATASKTSGKKSTVVIPAPAKRTVITSHGDIPPGQLKKQLGLKSARGVAPGHTKRPVTITDALGATRHVLLANGYQVLRVMPYNGTQIVYYQRPTQTLQRIVVVPDGEVVAFRYAPTTLLSQILAILGM